MGRLGDVITSDNERFSGDELDVGVRFCPNRRVSEGFAGTPSSREVSGGESSIVSSLSLERSPIFPVSVNKL